MYATESIKMWAFPAWHKPGVDQYCFFNFIHYRNQSDFQNDSETQGGELIKGT